MLVDMLFLSSIHPMVAKHVNRRELDYIDHSFKYMYIVVELEVDHILLSSWMY
jgi:hypothetical protein